MEKLSSLISKKIISLQEGELVGYCINALFNEDLKSLEGLIIVDEESEEMFLLKYKDIKSKSDECIMIDSSKVLDIFIEEDTYNPIGKVVYDTNGVNLGKVKDILLQGKIVRRVMTDKCEFFWKNIKKTGKNYVIYGTKEKKSSNKSFKENIKLNKNNMQKVSISQLQNKNIIQINNQNLKDKKINKPYRILANQNSILGRTMQEDLYGYNHEIIARKYDIINQNIINRAKNHNKLNFLIYYSK